MAFKNANANGTQRITVTSHNQTLWMGHSIGELMPLTWEASAAGRSYIEKVLIDEMLNRSSTFKQNLSLVGDARIASSTLTITHTLNVS